jgi:hypothetical protein
MTDPKSSPGRFAVPLNYKSAAREDMKTWDGQSLSHVISTCSAFTAATFVVIAELLSEENLWGVVVLGGTLILTNYILTMLHIRSVMAAQRIPTAAVCPVKNGAQKRRAASSRGRLNQETFVEVRLPAGEDDFLPYAVKASSKHAAEAQHVREAARQEMWSDRDQPTRDERKNKHRRHEGRRKLRPPELGRESAKSQRHAKKRISVAAKHRRSGIPRRGVRSSSSYIQV